MAGETTAPGPGMLVSKLPFLGPPVAMGGRNMTTASEDTSFLFFWGDPPKPAAFLPGQTFQGAWGAYASGGRSAVAAQRARLQREVRPGGAGGRSGYIAGSGHPNGRVLKSAVCDVLPFPKRVAKTMGPPQSGNI